MLGFDNLLTKSTPALVLQLNLYWDSEYLNQMFENLPAGRFFCFS